MVWGMIEPRHSIPCISVYAKMLDVEGSAVVCAHPALHGLARLPYSLRVAPTRLLKPTT